MRRVCLQFLGLLLLYQLNKVTLEKYCPVGFNILKGICTDDDECDYEENICGENAICYNTNGSYYCNCIEGYQTSSRRVNFTQGKGECRDINECSEDKDICGPNSVCHNQPGSYHCTCVLGFSLSNGMEIFNASHGVKCEDINECERDSDICGKNAKCHNTTGSFYCTCDPGYRLRSGQVNFTGNHSTQCEDMNECTRDSDICGQNAKCNNTIGSFYCTCDSGYRLSSGQANFTGNNSTQCQELKCDGNLTGSSTKQIFHMSWEMQQIFTNLTKSCLELTGSAPRESSSIKEKDMKNMLQRFLNILDNLFSAGHLDNRKITAMLEATERALKMIGFQLANGPVTASSKYTKVIFEVRRNQTAPQGPLTLSTNDTELQSHWETTAGDSYLGFAAASLLSFENLEWLFNGYFDNIQRQGNENFTLNSKVVTVTVTNQDTAHLKKPVTLTISHLQSANSNHTCVFWDSNLDGGAWSTQGCSAVQSNNTHTTCSCTHLSSFAVLMALYEQKDIFELKLITWIGLSLSLVCLFICILTFRFIRSIQSTRTTIHLHLCISLFIADFIFLVGISPKENPVGCAFVAGLLHYFFLACFCWMCLEGVQLFCMVVLVFNTTLRPLYLMAGGYGVPAVIVAVSAAIYSKGYGTERHCWLSLEKGFIWSFFAPVCVIILLNVFFFLLTIWKLAQKFSSLSQDLSNLRKIKSFTITAIAQLCVLGIMWIFGCFQFDESTLAMSYLFTIFNSLQGLLLFLLHCLLSKQVREEYIKILTGTCTPEKKKYSEFSSNKSSKFPVSGSTEHTGESHI